MKHGLKLNENKTQPIIISHSRLQNSIDRNNVPKITVNGVSLPYCDKVKNLGVTMTSTLGWHDAVVGTCKKVFASVHTLKRMQNCLPERIKLLLIKTLVFPHFSYCNAVTNDMTVGLANKLQRCQNYCLRFVFDLRRDKLITHVYIQNSILKLADLRLFKILKLLHLTLNCGEPKYLAEKFKFISEISARETRMTSSMLQIPYHRTSTYNKSFVVTACRAWNSLPNHRFAALLKAHLLQQMSAAH